MATSIANATTLGGLLECSVCLETFNNPKCLPCVHTFCLKCLEEYGKDRSSGNTMPCPMCRQTFEIPHGGFKKLPNNFFIEQLLEVYSPKLLEISAITKVMCDNCSEEDASKFCEECSQDLCESCVQAHAKMRVFQTHNITSQEEKNKSVLKTTRLSYCEQHPAIPLELYCNDCQTAMCTKCFSVEHKYHVASHIAQISEKFKVDIKHSSENLDQFVDDHKKELKELETDEKDYLDQLLASERAIKEKGEEVKRIVDLQVKELLERLESLKTERLKLIKTRKDEVERQLLILESYQKYVGVLTDRGTPYDVTRSTKDLLKRATDIVTSQETFENGKLDFQMVSFKKSDHLKMAGESTNLVGTVAAEDEYVKKLVAAGSGGSSFFHKFWHIDLTRKDTVSTIKSALCGLADSAAACTVADVLYVVGIGNTGNELWKYSTESQWIRLAAMESGRRRHCVAVVGSMLYVLGGWYKRTTLSNVLSYNISSNTWSTAGQLTHAARNAACIAYTDTIYLFGGQTDVGGTVDHVQMYNTVSQKCKLMPDPLPGAYSRMRAVLWKTSAVLFHHLTCFTYNFETQTWLERKQYKTDVSHFGLVLNNDTLYIAGGGTSQNDKDNKPIWTCSDEIKSVSVMDIISNKPAVWKHHAKLPQPALISVYSPNPLRLPR